MIRSQRLGSWTSLISLVVALPVATGCGLNFDLPQGDNASDEAGAEQADGNSIDPNDLDAYKDAYADANPDVKDGTLDPNDPNNPDGTGNSLSDGTGTDPLNSGATNPGYGAADPYAPRARRLALDLSGVAGFAIMDEESTLAATSAEPLASVGADSATAPAGNAAASAMYLGSSSLGQVIVNPHLKNKLASGSTMGLRSASAAGPDLALALAQVDPDAPPPADGSEPDMMSAADMQAADGEPAPADAAPPEEINSLMKLTDDGEVVPALVNIEDEPPADMMPADGQPPPDADAPPPEEVKPPPPGPGLAQEPLPWVAALGLSPDGSVYVLFERAFQYRDPTPEELDNANFDPWAPDSPLTCQLFHADGSWLENNGEKNLAELECVTNQHEIAAWDPRRVMQFDRAGNLYFPAFTPGDWQEVFFAYSPETKQLSEKVNANICWHDIQVTPRGSLFYTGTSGTNGDCNGTSFFRYVSVDNRLTEIARDWWDFKYLAEQDPDDPNNERIIFYGPDPNSDSDFGWDSACIYRYDPSIAEPTARTSRLANCSNNQYDYLNGGVEWGDNGMTPDSVTAFRNRCEADGKVFIGGEGVQTLSQMEDGTLFIVGSFNMLSQGVSSCMAEITASHCQSPTVEETTREECEAAGYSWMNTDPGCSDPTYETEQECFDNGHEWNWSGPSEFYNLSGDACDASREGFHITSMDCFTADGSPEIMSQVDGLAYLVPGATPDESEIVLISDPEEDVEAYWALSGPDGPEFYYSVYRSGQYSLRVASQTENDNGDIEVERRVLLTDFEVYNVHHDPSDLSRVLFDGLHFSTNSYQFGSIDPHLPTEEEVLASMEAVQGFSGKVDTLIILPDF